MKKTPLLWTLSGLLLLMPAASWAQQPSEAQRARLDAMFKAADALDEGADPAAYRKAFEEVLAYGKTLYPPDHPMLAWLEAEQITADYLQGDIKGARARSERISAVLEAAGGEWLDKRMLLANAQVVIYLTLSEFDKASELGEKVLAYRLETAQGKPSTELSAAYSNLANAEMRGGETDKAIAHIRQAIAVDRQLDPIPVNAAPHFANLPIFLNQAGRLEEAVEEARATQAVLERILPEGHPFLANNLNTLAQVLADLGRLGEAETVARKALDIAYARFGASQQTVSYLTTLSRVLTMAGKSEEALALSKNAVDQMTQALGPDADRTLVARETHGLALAAAGKGPEALAELKAVAALRAAKMPAFHRDRLDGYDRLAGAALRFGDLRLARSMQQEAQQLRREGGSAEDIAALIGEARLGAIEVRAGEGAAGLARSNAAATRLDERLREMEASGAIRSGRDRDIRKGFGWALEAAAQAGNVEQSFLLAQPVIEGSASQTARAVRQREGARDPAVADLLRNRQDLASELQTLLDRQLRLAGLGAEPERIAALEERRRVTSAALADATARLAAVAPELVADESAERLTLAQAQAALGPDEALLLAAAGPQQLTLFAVTSDGAAMAPAVSGEQVTALVSRLRASLQSNGDFDLDASHQLHELLFPQAIAARLASRHRLLIATNGALSSLPFALLAGPGTDRKGSPRWLVRDHALVTLPALAMLPSMRERGGGQAIEGFLAVGAPDLAAAPADGATAFRSGNMARQVRDLPSLPATSDELAALGQALRAGRQQVLTGDRATEAALRAADLSKIDILAFSTHGLVSGELEGLDEPALVLTPAGQDDGLLTASEIMRLRMDSDWVLLSACNTAAGSSADGGSLAGLARAFLHAGAHNLLASHWAVRDDVAALLSVGTVQRFAKGDEPAEALRKAMLRVMDEDDGKFGDPRLWAPFVFVGR